MRLVKIVQGPAVLRPTCPLRPGTHTDVGTPFCFLTTIKSKYSCKKAQIWLSVNAKIGLVYRVNPGLHVWAANDESLQMPQWAVCHTERRGRSWGASPTPGQAEWQKMKHTHTHTHFPFRVITVCFCCLTPGGSCVGGDEWASRAPQLINTPTCPFLYSLFYNFSYRVAEKTRQKT